MGWNGSNKYARNSIPVKKTTPVKKHSKIITASLSVFVILSGVLIFLSTSEKEEIRLDKKTVALSSKNKRNIVGEKKLHPRPKSHKPKMQHETTTNSPKWEAAVGLDPNLFPYKDGRKILSTRTNDWDQIIDICIMPNGRSRKVIRKATPQTFEHVTDQLIAMTLSGGDDIESTPLPIDDNLEKDFLESLKTPIIISEDDSDVVRATKENVIEARKIIHEELRNGYSFKEILTSHLDQRKKNAALKSDAMAAVRELKSSGDSELLNDYVNKVNELLREKGVSEIVVPLNKAERRSLNRKKGK